MNSNTRIAEKTYKKHLGSRRDIPKLNSRLKASAPDNKKIERLREGFASPEIPISLDVLKKKTIGQTPQKLKMVVAENIIPLADKLVKNKLDFENEIKITKSKTRIDFRNIVRNALKIRDKKITENDAFGYREKTRTQQAIESELIKIPNSKAKQDWDINEPQKRTKTDTKKVSLRLSNSHPNKVLKIIF